MGLPRLLWKADKHLRWLARRYSWAQLTPPQLFVVSFLAMIALGTAGLMWLPGLYAGPPSSGLDALFTATSAVCVTGLVVADTATHFTLAGQAFLLLLIQLGGLGMITFTTLIILVMGGRLPVQQELLSRRLSEINPQVDYRKLARDIVRVTLAAEALGALLLYVCWIPRLGWGGAVWHAVFHSVSAFCNAGFSTFPDSLMSWTRAPHALFVIMALIVMGGLGFLVIEELLLWQQARRAGRVFRFSVHSRLALTTTGVLLVGGWAGLTLFEWRATLAELPVLDRVVNGLFASVTARTAGFHTVDYAQATDSANFLTILLMAIGGSPGSMAGGLKTTTVALLGWVAWCRFRGYDLTTIAGRTVPEETVQRAVGLFVVMFGVVTLAIFLFTATELPLTTHKPDDTRFLSLMFEAASAFNTVGLSMGATHELTPTGKVITTLLMFLGRVGPLTFAAALARRYRISSRKFRYAYEDVAIG